MRKLALNYLLLFFTTSIFAQTRDIAKCGNEFTPATTDQVDQALLINNRTSATTGTIYRIPVVFHVLTDQPTGVSNISDCIIQNQVAILNNCFRRKSGAPNTNAAGADAEIEFYLARINPTGGATNGINRVTTSSCNYTTVNSTSQLSAIRTAAQWPTNKYLNIWVLKTMPNNNTVRGQAWYSGTNMGIFVHYSYLGSKNSGCSNLSYLDITGFQAYDLGMTVVHEVGHYLNLLHTFENCSPGDGCSDTPPVSGFPNPFCGTNNNTRGLCSGATSRQWQNYLDYTDDACMDRFTACQVLRMRSVLETNTQYTNLVTQTNFIATGGDIATSVNDLSKNEKAFIYPNPTKNIIRIQWNNYTPSSEYAVIGIDGSILLKGKATGMWQEINVSWLKPGAYALRIDGKNYKFIKE